MFYSKLFPCKEIMRRAHRPPSPHPPRRTCSPCRSALPSWPNGIRSWLAYGNDLKNAQADASFVLVRPPVRRQSREAAPSHGLPGPACAARVCAFR